MNKYNLACNVTRSLFFVSSLFIASMSYANHGGYHGGGHRGGHAYHGGGWHGGYHGGWHGGYRGWHNGYRGNYYRGNYYRSGWGGWGWGRAPVVVGVPVSGYYGGACTWVKRCYRNGGCYNQRICN
jgi:hypothetical protein